MNNSAVYNRFIDLFLESSEDYEPYGVIVPHAAIPVQVERQWGGDADQAEALMVNQREPGD